MFKDKAFIIAAVITMWVAAVVLLFAAIIGCTLQGPAGPQGPPGPAGADGQTITTVQFCPGYDTTYPSTFPEYGLCINSQLYAVYWDGSESWLALIVPGVYNSTSTTAPCSFTVGVNCELK